MVGGVPKAGKARALDVEPLPKGAGGHLRLLAKAIGGTCPKVPGLLGVEAVLCGVGVELLEFPLPKGAAGIRAWEAAIPLAGPVACAIAGEGQLPKVMEAGCAAPDAAASFGMPWNGGGFPACWEGPLAAASVQGLRAGAVTVPWASGLRWFIGFRALYLMSAAWLGETASGLVGSDKAARRSVSDTTGGGCCACILLRLFEFGGIPFFTARFGAGSRGCDAFRAFATCGAPAGPAPTCQIGISQ